MSRDRRLEFPEDFRFSDGTSAENPGEIRELVSENPDRASELAEHVATGDLTRWLWLLGHEQKAQRIDNLRRQHEGDEAELVARVVEVLSPTGTEERGFRESREKGHSPDDASHRGEGGSSQGTAYDRGPSADNAAVEPYSSRILKRQREQLRKFWRAGDSRLESEQRVQRKSRERKEELRSGAQEKKDQVHEHLAQVRTTLEEAREARDRAHEEWRDQSAALKRAVVMILAVLGVAFFIFLQTRTSGSSVSMAEDIPPGATQPPPSPRGLDESQPSESRGAAAGEAVRSPARAEGSNEPEDGNGGLAATGALGDVPRVRGEEIVKDAREQLPQVLESIFMALDRGEPATSDHIHRNLVSNSRLLNSLCPPDRHEAYYIASVNSLESGRVRAKVHHLSNTMRERVYSLDFTVTDSRLILSDAKVGNRWTRQLMRQSLEEATLRIRRFINAIERRLYHIEEDEPSTIESLTTEGFREDFRRLGRWERLLKGKHITGSISINSRLVRAHGIRPSLEVKVPIGRHSDKEVVRYRVGFAEVNGQLKIVALRDYRGRIAVRDPELPKHLARRFGLSGTGDAVVRPEI